MKKLLACGLILFCMVCINIHRLHAQDTLQTKTDTAKVDSAKHKLPFRQRVYKAVYIDHSPRAAELMSAVIPGLGQAYNRKYWKIPIIYAGVGFIVYDFIDNYTYYKQLKQSYVDKQHNVTAGDPYPQYDASQVLYLYDYTKNNLDLLIMGAAGLYVLNIVDAVVDAHFYHFDVSKNLSLDYRPKMIPYYGHVGYGMGISLHLK